MEEAGSCKTPKKKKTHTNTHPVKQLRAFLLQQDDPYAMYHGHGEIHAPKKNQKPLNQKTLPKPIINNWP